MRILATIVFAIMTVIFGSGATYNLMQESGEGFGAAGLAFMSVLSGIAMALAAFNV